MTKYKLLKPLPGIPVGSESTTSDLNLVTFNGAEIRLNFIVSEILAYPDWFQPIDEEQDKIDAAKKLLDEKGYIVMRKGSTWTKHVCEPGTSGWSKSY